VTASVARLPRGAGPAPVAGVAQQLLDWVVAWYGDHADTEPLPARRYVAGGAPREVAWDLQSGQVTVALERVITALHGDSPNRPGQSPRSSPANLGRLNRSAALEVQIVRCAPVPPEDPLALPPAEDLHAHGLLLDADAGHLLSAVVDAVRQGVLLREHVGQGNVVVGDVFSLGPMGGAAAVALMVTVPLL
jgi:hypothetical protein